MPANKLRKISLCLAGLCLTVLTACGQKGPLYLPEQEPPASQAEPQEPAEAEDEESPRH